ncbi:hypothetical protein M408DRAFT_25288 [Serendipita vermifera MAFF 305830]|uniref:Protein kinase domain-containing protein n=2 Tax=Serendipita vermifera MAFF 305830 TaxID=933852 RepID=A0A0C2XBR2_SERVB|nr:hypothetical protein M408DRAFT_25288 [Serendipita vermifera MAFF 305830]
MSLWDLHERQIDATGDARLNPQEIQALARQLTRLVYDLHESGHIHRDLKPENVLISETGVMVLADFGMTTRIGQRYEEDFGTDGFAIPYGKSRYNTDPRVDIWSLGATILNLAGADLGHKADPITEEDCQEVIEKHFPRSDNPDAHDFISKCLAFPKQGRKVMTAKRATEHPWITKPLGEDVQERLSLSAFKAARRNEMILRAGRPYFLNIGEGPCRELSVQEDCNIS